MTPDRWQRVSELLDSALRMEGGERAEFLDDACRGDAELHAEVLSLLDFDSRAGAFLAAPPGDLPLGLLGSASPRDDLKAGQQVGAYRLVERIAAGGMGDVWLAERGDGQFTGHAAVKLLKRGLDTDEIVAHFRRERQVLATLHHPNISRLLDGGVTPDGRPYLVMEYVDGKPIDQYCDERRLTVPERIELVRTVCSAVHAAHQRLVVHRDLKPGNILVSRDGAPTLLDFGIAKLLAPDEAAPGTTTTRQRFVTPEFASPEQLRGGPITTATDVYSLGVLLYVLLTGHRPFDNLEGDSKAPLRQPPRPSTIVRRPVVRRQPDGTSAVVHTAAHIAKLRRCDPRRLSRSLAGDLDTIVLMALREEPERRYASAEQLGDDLLRCLRHRPVRARPDALAYRARKFLRRNRVPVTLAAGAFVAVSALALRMYLQAERLTRQQSDLQLASMRIQAENARARDEAGRARRALRSLRAIIAQMDPMRTSARDLSIREFLDQSVRQIDMEHGGRPEEEGPLRNWLGQAYLNLGFHDQAEAQFVRALELRRSAYGDEHRDTIESLLALGQLRKAQGQFPAAEAHMRRALELGRRVLGDEDAEMAALLGNLGGLRRAQGDLGEAQMLLRAALRIADRTRGGDGQYSVAARQDLADVLQDRGEYEESEKLYRESLAALGNANAVHTSNYAATLNSLADLCSIQGRFEEADTLLKQSLDVCRRVYGDEHPYTAAVVNNIGLNHHNAGRLAQAEGPYREALGIRRKTLGDRHVDVGVSLNNLGSLLVSLDRVEEAEPLLRQAIEVYRAAVGDADWRTANCRGHLGECLRRTGRYADAEPELLACLEGLQRALVPSHPGVIRTLQRLLTLYEEWGRPAKADFYRARLAAASQPVHPPATQPTASSSAGG